MLISDLVVQARRILGDIQKQRWSDERMLDIINDGLRDINKFAGVYRNEHFFELMNYQTRYPLPTDLLTVTSTWHNKQIVHMQSREALSNTMFIIKDQLNVGVMEVANPPDYVFRDRRFVAGPKDLADTGESLSLSLWTDGTWTGLGLWTTTTLWGEESGQVYEVPITPLEGVATTPVDDVFGVTEDLTIGLDIYTDNPATSFGLLTAILPRSQESIPLKTGGNPFGVVTSVNIATIKASSQAGAVGFVNKPFRIVGRYGTVTSVLKPEEYIRVLYKALPPRMHTLDTAFPLSPSWESPMVNWIVGGALQDDNDANNNQRAVSFLARYQRELDKEIAEASIDYSRSSKKYKTTYRGGITND